MFADERPQFLSFGHALRTFIVCGFLAIAGVAVFRYWDATVNGGDSLNGPAMGDDTGADDRVERLREERTQLEAELEELSEERNALNREVAGQKQLAAETRSRNEVLLSQGQSVRTKLGRLKAELTAWRSQWEKLQAGEDGRRVVASDSHLEYFSGLGMRERMSDEDLTHLEDVVESLMHPLETPEAQQGLATPSDDHNARMNEVASAVQRELTAVSNDFQIARRLLKETEDLPPASQTLEEAIQVRRNDEARAIADQVELARRQAISEKVKILQQAEQQKIAAEAELERQKIALETARAEHLAAELRSQQEAEQQALAERQAKAQLLSEMRADMDDIKSFLSGFITPGYRQLTTSGSYYQTTDQTPHSLAEIRGLGALNRDIKGLHMIHKIGAHGHNDRPRGALAPYDPRVSVDRVPSIRQQAERAQQLLLKYGRLMVEQDLLRP